MTSERAFLRPQLHGKDTVVTGLKIGLYCSLWASGWCAERLVCSCSKAKEKMPYLDFLTTPSTSFEGRKGGNRYMGGEGGVGRGCRSPSTFSHLLYTVVIVWLLYCCIHSSIIRNQI